MNETGNKLQNDVTIRSTLDLTHQALVSNPSPAHRLAGDGLLSGQQNDSRRKYQPTAKPNTAKMPMTCHNRRPQNTTVSEVMGSGFFGGSVGKSCKVKKKPMNS